MIISEVRATLTISIMDSMRQRELSVEAAAEIAAVDTDRMRALVERRDFKVFGLDELVDILDAIDASGPRYGRKP